MAKKKRRNRRKKMNAWQRFKKATFGNKFNFWDVLAIVVIIGYPAYIVAAFGTEILISDTAGYVWGGLVGSYLTSLVKRKSGK